MRETRREKEKKRLYITNKEEVETKKNPSVSASMSF